MKRQQLIANRIVLVFAALFVVAWVGGCAPTEEAKESPKNNQWRHSIYPITVKDKTDFIAEESSKATEAENSTPIFKKHLQQLAEYISKARNSEFKVPNIFNQDVEVYALDRESFTSSFAGERIRVARWRSSDSDRRRLDEVGIKHLASELTKPWNDSETFRVEFKIYKVHTKSAYFDVDVLAEMNGRIDSNTGRSATGLWKIRWHKNKRSDNQIKIDSIRLLGHEEILSFCDNGLLLEDCAASVLRRDEKLVSELGFGMDQMAKNVPGADILGHNGISVSDVNRDGLDDVYICQSHGLPNILLIQNPDGTADDQAAAYGVDVHDQSYASLIIDLDNDGDQDLVVATDRALALFSNTNQGRFQLEHKLVIGHGTQSLSAADVDQDGDLDLFLSKYRPTWVFNDIFPHPRQRMESNNGGRNVLLRNDEGWNFKDVTEEVGLGDGNDRYSTAGIWADCDVDGDLDLFVTNEFHSDCYYENRDGWLSKKTNGPIGYEPGRHTTASTGDFNGDSRPDVLVGSNVSFETARFIAEYLLHGGRYAEEAKGVAAPSRFWSIKQDEDEMSKLNFPAPIFSFNSAFSSAVADLNNDALDDVMVTNGWLTRSGKGNLDVLFLQNKYDIPVDGDEQDPPVDRRFKNEISELCRAGYSFSGFQRNRCMLQIDNGRFANFSGGAGFDFLEDSRAIATTDWDWDGDVDVILTCRTAPRFRIMRNNLKTNNFYLTLQLKGTESNRDAIGSRVELFVAGRDLPIVKTLSAGSGRASQSSKKLHFGLGKSSRIQKAVVHWPNGQSQEFNGLQANKIYSITEGRDEPAEISNSRSKIALETGAIPQKEGLPPRKSIAFYPTTRLPIIEFQGEREKWFNVTPLKELSLMVIVSPYDDEAFDRIEKWASHYREVVDANIDLLPLFFHADLSESSLFNRIHDKMAGCNFPFRWGTLADSSRDKLSLICGDWFYDGKLPSEPFGFLLSPDGQVHHGYRAEQLNWETIKEDNLEMLRTVALQGISATPPNENWLSRFRLPKLDRIEARVKELGYVSDANRYSEFTKDLRADAYYNKAWELSSKGDLAEAAQLARESLEKSPKYVPALIGAAKIAQKQASTVKSQTRIQLLRHSGKLLDDAIALDPANSEAFIARADIYRELKDVDQALAQLKQYLEFKPEAWQVHAIIGRLLFYKGDDAQATEYLVRAFENRPTLPFVAGELGFLYLRGGQYEDARKFLRLASRLQPSDASIIKQSSEAEFWSGNLEESIDRFTEAVKTNPTKPRMKRYLAWMLATSPFGSQRDGEKGIDILEPIYDNYSEESAFVLEIQAACLAESGKFSQAVEIQNKALEMVEAETASESYTDQQLEGLEERLELYRRSKPFRMSDARRDMDKIPLKTPGR